jgi:hypothetical protein
MKLFKSWILALMCAVAQGAWAQSPTIVTTDEELRAAVQNDNASILLANDIELSNSTLEIKANATVTLNLGGHTLDRKLTQSTPSPSALAAPTSA